MDSTIVTVIVAIVCLAVGFIVSFFISKNNAKGASATAEQQIEDARKAAETIRREAQVEAKDQAMEIKESAKNEAAKLTNQARIDADTLTSAAKTEAERLKEQVRNEVKEQSREIQQREERLQQREQSCDRRSDSLEQREASLNEQQGRLEQLRNDYAEKSQQVEQQLVELAGMTREEAKTRVLTEVKEDCMHDAGLIIREIEEKTKAEADRKSREILSVAIQRMSADFTAERTVTTVQIPSDDVKGRIIGREGRNIRSFEQITGANLIIDDSPEAVMVSCYDPVRRETARITLENLIADGRIHPARIEEMFNKAAQFVNQQVQEAGEQASFDMGIYDLHPELVRTLGRLRYRTSYGQNVLQHSLEVASLASTMASELGLDPVSAKRAGLLHDLGKAVDHEVEGSHAAIGADLARRYGESPAIVHAIEAHHNEVEPSTVLAVLVMAADAVSAARPGARRESYDNYIRRLERIEEIANAHKGVEKTYAMQAGREVRVMVQPEVVDDAQAAVVAREIAKQIEDEMEYPGQVHVVVIRESRSEALAK